MTDSVVSIGPGSNTWNVEPGVAAFTNPLVSRLPDGALIS
jgi:hypothetical protein